MYSSKRKFVTIAAILLFLIMVMSPVPPSFGSTDNPTWDLIQAFKEALQDQESDNQRNLLPLLAITFLLLGLIIFWVRIQTKYNSGGKKGLWGINDTRSADDPGEQRRSWIRLPVNQYFLYAKDEAERYRKSKIINISGGGLLFATDQEIKQNDKLKINIEITPGKKLNLTGEAVWISANPDDNTNGRFLVGIQFVNIRKGEQDSIIRRILQKQQEIILQEKRKEQSECVMCGKPLPEADKEENRSLCPRCRATKENTWEN